MALAFEVEEPTASSHDGRSGRHGRPLLRLPLFWAVLCIASLLGCLASTRSAWASPPTLPRSQQLAATVADDTVVDNANVESTAVNDTIVPEPEEILQDAARWLVWLQNRLYEFFLMGQKRYLHFWDGNLDEICRINKIMDGCCEQIKDFIEDNRWTIYHLSFWAFVFGALFIRGIYKVGYYAKPLSPRYWRHRSYWNPFFDNFIEEVDVTDEWKDAIQELFDLTTDPRRMGKGMDGSFVKHKGFKVTKVTRIENGYLWTSYKNAVSSTMRKMPRERLKKIPEDLARSSRHALNIIEKHMVRIHSMDAAGKFVKSLRLNKRINETLLFHGCLRAGARDPATGEVRFSPEDMSPLEAMKKAGFDDRLASSSGMLGSGTYFADMASKADQYAGKYGAPDESTVGEEASMFLARVALGCPYLSQTSLEQMRRPPCVKGHFDHNLLWSAVKYGQPWRDKGLPLQICNHSRFDSVMSDRRVDGTPKLYHEYAVYAKQCYPEFCVTYIRTRGAPGESGGE